MADKKRSARRSASAGKTRRTKLISGKAKPAGPAAASHKTDDAGTSGGKPEGTRAAKEAEVKEAKATADPGGASAGPTALEVTGDVDFDPGIISDIAVREASEIEGIAELTGGWRTKGVQVGESTDGGAPGYVVDLRIAVEYGVNCVALAETIRSRIGDAISRMTGRNAAAINVHVTGIRHKDLREEPHEEAGPLGEEHGIDF